MSVRIKKNENGIIFGDVGVKDMMFSFFYRTVVGGVSSVVERRSLADVLSLSCARPAADG